MKKNVTPILGYLSIVVTCAFLLFSCKKSVNNSPETDSNKDRVYEYIKKLGFRDKDIKDIGDKYVVDGDILFDKNSDPDFSILEGPKTEQYGTANYIGYDEQPHIGVYIDPSMFAYAGEVDNAIALWNNVPNCRLKFVITVIRATAKIQVIKQSGSYCSSAYFPMNGLPGPYIYVDNIMFPQFSYEQKVGALASMFGHSIGFRHTNWFNNPGEGQSGISNEGAVYDAMHIMGTPSGTDPNSIMNSGWCGETPSTLSDFDILAMQFLYPANPPVAGTVPVFRYYARNTIQDHFYTTNYGDLQDGSHDNYLFEGIGFFAFPNQVANSVPVYRFWRTGNTGDHFYTTNYDEIPASEHNVNIPEGIAFYAYPSAINGSVPVYRCYNNSTGDHFYTKNQLELSYMPGYSGEGTGWYAY